MQCKLYEEFDGNVITNGFCLAAGQPGECTALCNSGTALNGTVCTPIPLGCGNGVLEGAEQCDDGNNVSNDGCSIFCTDDDGLQICGNDILEAPEECDDDNT